jgi:hypothetical protein
MSFHRSWPGRALAVGSLVAVITSIPVTAIAADALRHPEGTLKLTERQFVAGSMIPIGGEKFAKHGKLKLLLVGVAGRFPVGDATADSVGAFSESFGIPADIEPGAYRLIAVAVDGDEVASLNVELLAESPAPDEGSALSEDDTAHPDDGHHDVEFAEESPTAEPLTLDRAASPWIRGGAVVGIIIALVSGGLLLRKPQGTV